LYPPAQSRPILSASQQAQALARIAAGDSYRAIAADLGVSRGAIYRLVQRTRKGGER